MAYAYVLSSELPGGYTGEITADLINRLWYDVFVSHEHASASGDGPPIQHGDLDDEAIPNTHLTHITLNKHVQGSGTSATPDDPGGSAGVHGLSSTQHVAGISKDQWVVQVATGTTDRYSTKGQRGRAHFTVPFQEAPQAFAINLTGETAATTVYQRLITSVAVRFKFVSGSTYDGSQKDVAFAVIAFGKVGERIAGY